MVFFVFNLGKRFNLSNIQRAENVKQVVYQTETDFNDLAKIHGAVNFKKEASFAMQILSGNSFLMQVAMSDQDSLRNAVVNVAAIGLTLSPLMKLAYLIPRKGKVCLDISYLGYVNLGIAVGAIKWAGAEIVREKDTFRYLGMNERPVHEFEPFKDRGEIVGAYCLAKTNDGEFILTHMHNDQVLSIRDRSESYMAFVKDNSKSTPWKTDTEEMIKKTVIRRAYKSWPKSSTKSDDRFERAIQITNDFEPLAVSAPADVPEGKRELCIKKLRSDLVFIERDEAVYVEHLARVNRREIKKIEDMTDVEMSQAAIMMQLWVDAKTKKDKEAINENAG